jgi:tetratricopeptide (TPR) repeat protein
MKIHYIIWLILPLLLGACKQTGKEDNKADTVDSLQQKQPDYEALSLLGDTLRTLDLSEAERTLYDSALLVAEKNYQSAPDNLENIIWYGRRLAYAGRFKQSIEVYTKGIQKFPQSAALYRHRGHRYITLRQFDKAVADLNKASALIADQPVEPEPNGLPLPNPSTQLSSLQFNIFYHLGLAYYLLGEYGNAAEAYEKCLEYADNDDATVAVADWLYMSYRRLGEDEVAEKTLGMIQMDMKVNENQSYYDRLLMYKGMIPPDSVMQIEGGEIYPSRDLTLATQGYGVANYYLDLGDEEKAREIFQMIVDGTYWPAFGHIAAEADLRRLQQDTVDF